MPFDTLEKHRPTGSGGSTGNADLSVFQVMPRAMYFGPSLATSVDLCVRDLVSAGRFRATTKIFAEKIDDPFAGFTVDHLPPARCAATFVRANYVARIARQERPDLIIVQQHLPTAAAIARRLPGAKVVLHTHNFQKSYSSDSRALNAVHRGVKKSRYGRLAGIIHVSKACEQRFATAWADVAVPGCVVNNGLDFGNWRPARSRSREILFAGRCAPEKGVLEAAQAVAWLLPKFPDWRARFAVSQVDARPDYFQRLREALSGCGAQARIEVQRPFAEIKAAFERAAIALVPSTWIEPFGRTALEAHAGGAALISSGTGGLAEISGETALTLPAVTPDAIARAAEALITNEALRERLARQGAERVRALFDIKVQAAKLDRFLSGIATARAGWG